MIRKRIDLLKLRNTQAKDVESIGNPEIRIIKDLYDVMFSGPNYVGFAAPQIGYFKQIMLADDTNGNIDLMINPRLLDMSGEQMHVEGCFSVPDIWGYAVSPYQVEIQFLDSNFSEKTVVRKGFAATIAFHEWGHLNGKLFLDRSKEIFTLGADTKEEEKSNLLKKYPSRVIRKK